MKAKLILFLAIIVAVFVSCSDDDPSPKKDIMLISERFSGTVYTIDVTTGEMESLFTPMYNAEPLNALRGCVYHSGLKKLFVTQTSNEGGGLYSIDPKTLDVVQLNGNDGQDGAAIWDAVVNWTVVEADSLIGYGDFNGDGNGLYKFGVDGGRAPNITEINSLCCGLGMIFDVDKEEIITANNNDADNMEVIFDKVSFDGTVTPMDTVRTFNGFVEDLSASWLTMKALAEHKGDLYGLLYDSDFGITYFVKVDLTTYTITNISKLGTTANLKANAQFNMLYSVSEAIF